MTWKKPGKRDLISYLTVDIIIKQNNKYILQTIAK